MLPALEIPSFLILFLMTLSATGELSVLIFIFLVSCSFLLSIWTGSVSLMYQLYIMLMPLLLLYCGLLFFLFLYPHLCHSSICFARAIIIYSTATTYKCNSAYFPLTILCVSWHCADCDGIMMLFSLYEWLSMTKFACWESLERALSRIQFVRIVSSKHLHIPRLFPVNL